MNSDDDVRQETGSTYGMTDGLPNGANRPPAVLAVVGAVVALAGHRLVEATVGLGGAGLVAAAPLVALLVQVQGTGLLAVAVVREGREVVGRAE